VVDFSFKKVPRGPVPADWQTLGPHRLRGMDLPSGLTGHAVLTVAAADTAEAVGSGDVPVLATPRVLALAEAATVDALRDRLPADLTTVGVKVELFHQAATPVGAVATAAARLVTVDGRSLRFTVTVTDDALGEARVIAEGTVERAAVDRARFLARLPRISIEQNGGQEG
jgi:predicted thioesterase